MTLSLTCEVHALFLPPCHQEAAAHHGGAGAHREGVRALSGLHPVSLPPTDGQVRHSSGPSGQAWGHLWKPGEALRLPQSLFLTGAGGLREAAGHGGSLLSQTCEK